MYSEYPKFVVIEEILCRQVKHWNFISSDNRPSLLENPLAYILFSLIVAHIEWNKNVSIDRAKQLIVKLLVGFICS